MLPYDPSFAFGSTAFDWGAAGPMQPGGAAGLAWQGELNPFQAEIDGKRRAAFLDPSTDSMGGLRNMRSVLAQEAGLPAGPHWDKSVNELNRQAVTRRTAAHFAAAPAQAGVEVKAPPPGSGPSKDLVRRAFGLDSQLAGSSSPLGVRFSDQLQGPVAERARASAPPLSQPVAPEPVRRTVVNGDGDTERALAAYAALGLEPAFTDGQLALAAQNAMPGTRGGQFVPGATVSLPRLDPSQLPPLHTAFGQVSGLQLPAYARGPVPSYGFGGMG